MQALKDMIDAISSPQLLTAVVVIVFVLALRFRQLTLSPVSYLFLLLPVIALVVGASVLIRGIRNDDVIDLGLAAVCVCLALWGW
jgi:hypothetical protein